KCRGSTRKPSVSTPSKRRRAARCRRPSARFRSSSKRSSSVDSEASRLAIPRAIRVALGRPCEMVDEHGRLPAERVLPADAPDIERSPVAAQAQAQEVLEAGVAERRERLGVLETERGQRRQVAAEEERAAEGGAHQNEQVRQ